MGLAVCRWVSDSQGPRQGGGGGCKTRWHGACAVREQRSELCFVAGRPCSPQAPVARHHPGSSPSMDRACGGSASTLEYNLLPHPFSLTVTRSGDDAPLFNSTGQRLVFKDQYLELSTGLSPGATLFGAGERVSRSLHLARNGAPRPLWNRDIGPALEEQNSYGSHPWVLGLEPGTARGGVPWARGMHLS